MPRPFSFVCRHNPFFIVCLCFWRRQILWKGSSVQLDARTEDDRTIKSWKEMKTTDIHHKFGFQCWFCYLRNLHCTAFWNLYNYLKMWKSIQRFEVTKQTCPTMVDLHVRASSFQDFSSHSEPVKYLSSVSVRYPDQESQILGVEWNPLGYQFLVRPAGTRPGGRPGTRCRGYMSARVWERLRMPQSEKWKFGVPCWTAARDTTLDEKTDGFEHVLGNKSYCGGLNLQLV